MWRLSVFHWTRARPTGREPGKGQPGKLVLSSGHHLPVVRSAGNKAWWRFPAMPSPRFGPRQIRAESVMVRRYNGSTGAAPFDSLRVADIGDVNVNLYNLPDSCRLIRESYQEIVASGCVPLTLGKEPVSPCPATASWLCQTPSPPPPIIQSRLSRR